MVIKVFSQITHISEASKTKDVLHVPFNSPPTERRHPLNSLFLKEGAYIILSLIERKIKCGWEFWTWQTTVFLVFSISIEESHSCHFYPNPLSVTYFPLSFTEMKYIDNKAAYIHDYKKIICHKHKLLFMCNDDIKSLYQKWKSAISLSTLFRLVDFFFHSNTFLMKEATCWYIFWHNLLTS